jgi:hypothetical protein
MQTGLGSVSLQALSDLQGVDMDVGGLENDNEVTMLHNDMGRNRAGQGEPLGEDEAFMLAACDLLDNR